MPKNNCRSKEKDIEIADKIFSIYIRNRDCPDGKGHCISCGRPITPETSDCGHYIPRHHLSTRYDERNCNAQCVECNRMKYGNIPGYTKGLMRKYGDYIIDDLISLGKREHKMSQSDFEDIITTYKKKLYEIGIKHIL